MHSISYNLFWLNICESLAMFMHGYGGKTDHLLVNVLHQIFIISILNQAEIVFSAACLYIHIKQWQFMDIRNKSCCLCTYILHCMSIHIELSIWLIRISSVDNAFYSEFLLSIVDLDIFSRRKEKVDRCWPYHEVTEFNGKLKIHWLVCNRSFL